MNKVGDQAWSNGEAASSPSTPVTLKRRITVWSGIALMVGSIIGSGIFISPGGVLNRSGSVGASLIVWSMGGVIAALGTLCYTELGLMIPESGGDYTYILAGVGPLLGFLYCWMNAFVMKPAAIALLSQICAGYIVQPFYLNATFDSPEAEHSAKFYPELFTALLVIFLVTFVNCYSVRWSNAVNSVLTVVKLIPLVIILIAGIVNICIGKVEHLDDGFQPIPGIEISFGTISLAFYSAMWSYDGWNQLNFVTEEIKNPKRNLPLAIGVSIPFITVVYLLVNISYLTLLSPMEIINSTAVANEWAVKLLEGSTNPTLQWLSAYVPMIMAAFVAASVIGATNGAMFTAGRANFAAARANQLPEVIAMVHKKTLTPIPSLLLLMLMSIFYALVSDAGKLLDFFSFAVWTFYTLAFLSVVTLRFRRPKDDRPFKVWIGIPVLMTLIGAYLVIAPIVDNPQLEYFYVLGFMFAGLLLYFPFVYKQYRIPGLYGVYRKIEKIFNFSLSEKDL